MLILVLHKKSFQTCMDIFMIFFIYTRRVNNIILYLYASKILFSNIFQNFILSQNMFEIFLKLYLRQVA